MDKIPIAVCGAGYLGTRHGQKLRDSKLWDLRCVYDVQEEKAQALAQELECSRARSLDEMIERSQALVVATSTTSHYEVARAALEAGRPTLVEKPFTGVLSQAQALQALAEEKGAVLQAGYVERFNPAIRGVAGRIPRPLFVESHRLAPLVPRSLDINVLQDLMVHDIDLALMFIGGEPESVIASGVPVLSEKVDIANTRLTFPGGITANLTVSRVSLERTRKFRMFFPGHYVSIDCAARKANLYHLRDDSKGAMEDWMQSGNPLDMLRFLNHTVIEDDGTDALTEEHRAFRYAIEGEPNRGVGAEEAIRTLRVLVAVEDSLHTQLGEQ